MSLTKADHGAFSDAIEAGNVGLVKSMITRYPSLVCHPDWTPPPIHCAVLWNQPAIVEVLLDNGADIEALDPDRQTTPLRYAIMYCRIDLIPLLLSRGANANPIVPNGTTALQLAVEGSSGTHEEYEDLPPREEYEAVVTVLQQAGLNR